MEGRRPRALWERLRAEGPVKAPPVDPREVARWCWVQRRSAHAKGDGYHGGNGTHKISETAPAPALSTLPTLPASILPDARDIDPPQLPPGSVVYIDPPYVNTTGYAHDLGREAVCELAERWASAGAWVVISEAEPLSELDGWHQVEITGSASDRSGRLGAPGNT